MQEYLKDWVSRNNEDFDKRSNLSLQEMSGGDLLILANMIFYDDVRPLTKLS
jgi:hypothetical protein